MAIFNSYVSLPEGKVLEHFDIEIYFPPQRRAIFDLSSDQMAPHRFSEPNFRPA